jgi:hypothetical protein
MRERRGGEASCAARLLANFEAACAREAAVSLARGVRREAAASLARRGVRRFDLQSGGRRLDLQGGETRLVRVSPGFHVSLTAFFTAHLSHAAQGGDTLSLILSLMSRELTSRLF